MSEFKLPSSMVAGLLCAMFLPALPLQAQGFIDGAKSDLLIRNYYFDRDYLGESAQRAQREWAEGFVLHWASGYTPGAVGFGLEAQGMLGLKLDSTASRSASGLLHYDPLTREPDGHYSKFNLTAKLKASKTELLVGSVVPFLPVVFSSPTRLFQHTFRGAYLQSRDVDRLSLHAGVLDRARLRDGVDYVPMRISAPNGRFDPAAESDRFRFIGGDYALTGNLTLKAYSADLDELYRQQYLGVVDERAVGRGRLKSDFRLFLSAEDGAGRAGPVDNTNAMLNVTWSHGVHSIGGGYMQLSGDTAMPYVAGTEPLVMVEELMSAEFLNPDERTVQVRYDRSFGDVGLPGLKTTWRYARGTGFDLPAYAARDLTESEKHIEVAYTVQQGALAGLRLRVRNSWLRSDAPHVASQRDGDELRINIDYTLKLLP